MCGLPKFPLKRIYYENLEPISWDFHPDEIMKWRDEFVEKLRELKEIYGTAIGTRSELDCCIITRINVYEEMLEAFKE